MIKNIFYKTIHATGLTGLVQRKLRFHVPILFYHGVTDASWEGVIDCEKKHIAAEDFEKQLVFLKENFRVIALREYVESLRSQTPLPPNAVVITFDDGYENNYSTAYPLLKKYRMPATFYIATDFVEKGEPLWVDRLACAFAFTDKPAFNPEPEIAGVSLKSQRDRIEAYLRTKNKLKRLKNNEREKLLDRIAGDLLGNVPHDPPRLFYPLKREQIREMARSGLIEIGAHSLRHPILTSLPLDQARTEIVSSKEKASEISGQEVTSFSYPDGVFNEELVKMVKEAGFHSAVGVGLRLNGPGAYPLTLSRLALAEGDQVPVMAATLCGIRGKVNQWMSRRDRGLNIRPPRVLVLDGDLGASLAIVRSLGSRGVSVDVGERKKGSLASYSRFALEEIAYPDPLTEPLGFVETLKTRLRRTHYDLVIPVTDDTVEPLASARHVLERETQLALAPSDALGIAGDKAKTIELAEGLGIPIPKSRIFMEEKELATVALGFPYPVAVKPSRSIAAPRDGRNALRTKLSVMYAHDATELRRFAKAMLPFGAVIAQEYFRGTGVGLEILADHGEIVYSFQHKRLHELPLTGGGSCLRESAPVNPKLLESTSRLIRASHWHGVAMAEFKINESTGDFRLMEVNGRFWGSLALAVQAGADFPSLLLDLLTENKRPHPSMPPPKIGVVTRKLSSDLLWYARVLRPDRSDPLIQWPTRFSALRDLFLIFSPRHGFDIQSLHDPVPGLVDVFRIGKRFARRFVEIAQKNLIAKAQERKRREGSLPGKDLPRAREILFVCYGNINRSILAEYHLRSLLAPGSKLRVKSAGFHGEEGRAPDPSMLRQAQRHGLSLAGASSRALDGAMLDSADLILVMEVEQLRRLASEFPAARRKAFLLSCVTNSPEVPLEIRDPYGGDEASFARCFNEIAACTSAMAQALSRSGGRA